MTGVKLAAAMALIVPPVNEFKRQSLQRADTEGILAPTLVVLRDDRVIAAIITPKAAATLACAHTVAVGLAPQMLALAAQVTLPDGSKGIAYTSMTSDHQAALAVQPYAVGDEGITFGIPERGDPEDHTIMDELAKAMNHAPIDASSVSAKSSVPGAEAQTLTPDRGRHVLDASTCASLHNSVKNIAGTVLFVPESAGHAGALIEHGMPRDLLIGPAPSGSSDPVI